MLLFFRVAGHVVASFSVSLNGAAGFSEGGDWLHTWQTFVSVVLADDLLLDLEVVRPTRGKLVLADQDLGPVSARAAPGEGLVHGAVE